MSHETAAQKDLPLRDHYQENRVAIDRFEDHPLRGAGCDGVPRDLTKGERLQVIELLHRLNFRCPIPGQPVAQWKVEVAKLRIVPGRKTVDRRTIQRWTALAVECGLVALEVNVRASGGSEWNSYTVDWRAVRGDQRAASEEATQERRSDLSRRSDPANPDATRCDTMRHGVASNDDLMRHGVASGCDTVSHPTPRVFPKELNTPPPPRAREPVPSLPKRWWRKVEKEFDRLELRASKKLCRLLHERGVPPQMVIDLLASDRRLRGAEPGTVWYRLLAIDDDDRAAWRSETGDRIIRVGVAEGVARPRIVATLRDYGCHELAAWFEAATELPDDEILRMLASQPGGTS